MTNINLKMLKIKSTKVVIFVTQNV